MKTELVNPKVRPKMEHGLTMYAYCLYSVNTMKKETRIQIRLDREDVKMICELVKAKRYGTTRSEVLRRCLYETHARHMKEK